MASKYWIKLYIEILDDPKMGQMSDRLFRRTIQLFLLAGDLNGSGILPSVDDMAWRLRLSQEELETDLADLASTGIVHKNGDHWVVTKFEDRQSPVSGAERMRRYRERKQKSLYYGDEPVTKRNVDTDTDKESDTDKTADGRHLFDLYEQEIGLLTPHIGEQIGDWIDAYSHKWVEDAIKIAAENNKRKTSYINGILKNWKTEGRDSKKKPAIDKELERQGYVRH
jgi:DnaD/phage-associated family protein